MLKLKQTQRKNIQNHRSSCYCSIHDGEAEFGDLTLIENCFIVASNALWLPEK